MTSAERVAKRRAALRAQGLRPVTLWLPDRRSPHYLDQVGKDVAAINRWWKTQEGSETADWIDAMQGHAIRNLPDEDGTA